MHKPMTKDEFNRASSDTVFVFTAHLKDNAFGQKARGSQTATLGIIANAWLDVQHENMKSGILALSPGGTDKFGRGTADIVGTKGSVEKLFREFAADITHMGFAEYAPPAIPAVQTAIPGIAQRR